MGRQETKTLGRSQGFRRIPGFNAETKGVKSKGKCENGGSEEIRME